MYHVIIVLDESRNKSYYYSYIASGGNIECAELPPYQDINKARSCYWNIENSAWVYDADKYAEITVMQTAAEQEKKKAEAAPTNEELAVAIMEIADNVSIIMEAVPELAEKVALMKGGE